MKGFLGVFLVVLGLAIAIIPQFTNCEAQGRRLTLASGATTPMKCTWTARAELATGIPILGIGAMIVFARRNETLRYMGGLSLIMGVFAMLLPTRLIGVCSSSMQCHTVMQPSLLTFGGLVIGSGIAVMALSLRKGQ
jgi:hypothetical protein